MWEEFERSANEMFRFVNGRKVVLWGYERSGWFIEHLFRRHNKQIEYIIDDSFSMSFKLHVFRSFILEGMDKDCVAVLLTFADDGKARSFLEKLGYREGVHFMFVRDIFYRGNVQRKLSYYDWLEYKFDVDIIGMKAIDEIIRPNEDGKCYAAGIDYPLIEVLDNFSFSIGGKADDALFDFGCGKGNIFPLCIKAGINRFGGVEYDPELYSIACENCYKLGCSTSGLIKGDAAFVREELDDYNYFFIQNSFVGETFDRVMRNLQESYDRKRRKITLIYAGAYCHERVLQNTNLKMSKTVDTDYYIRYVNIYTMPNAI